LWRGGFGDRGGGVGQQVAERKKIEREQRDKIVLAARKESRRVFVTGVCKVTKKGKVSQNQVK